MTEHLGFPLLAGGLCSAAGLERRLTCLQLQAESDVFDSYSFWAEYPEDDDFSFPFAGVRLFERATVRATRLAHLLVSALDETLASVAPGFAENPPTVLVAVPRNLKTAEQELLGQVFAETAARHNLNLPSPRWVFGGREAAGEALVQALPLLRGGAPVIVAAVDSLCDPDELTRLQKAKRLLEKGSEGVIPGEAAGCVLLGPAEPTHTGTRLLAAAARADDGSATVLSQRNNLTAAFADERIQALAPRCAGRAYVASTGEGFLAQDINHAYLRHPEWWPEPLDVFESASVLGDTGTAGTLIQMLFADFQMQRTQGQGTRQRALVVAAGDSDAGAVVMLEQGAVS
ncbi:hypothetical protein [Acanthopleuribacter pedis]|uniref:Beta-ketoacyl synthase N-terminal domain-containing protein n=1 Tax=Acanthopleuribacter pedis TaxID=442870 RepID=A0A8J7U346_9BACT|nr:hypothetical protein [Acanthopleuribacter pedis]MBO1317953.1 hypothetical protein [Acanthopleuribacter pedis]